MKTRKIVAFILAVLCCFMTGCGNNNETEATEPTVNYNTSFTYDRENYILTITGKGKMLSEDPWQWIDNYYPKHVVVSDGITNIADSAFSYLCLDDESEYNNFNQMVTIEIPDSVTKIGNNAFQGCAGLRAINIPDSVVKIGEEAFLESGLTSISLPDNLKKVPEGIFERCNKLITVELGENTESIGSWAFWQCTSLKNIKFNDKLKVIEDAFFLCVSLSDVTLPDSLTCLGKKAFEWCPNLTKLELPASLEKLENKAIFCCKKLKEVIVKGKDTEFGKYALGYIRSKKEIVPIENFTIKGYKGSTAEQYATENGFNFVALDE